MTIEKENAAAESEEKVIKIRAKELFDKGLLKEYEVGTFKGLASIHEYLYGGISDQAGKKRTVDIVKGNMRFTPVNALDTGIEFADIMPFDTFDEIIDKFVEMNIVHPFRTGNSIALRIWLNEMMREKTGEVVDFSAIEKEEFTAALEKSHTDDEKLYKLLKSALKSDIGRDMYLKGIDASFAFEGFCDYSVFKL
ncbi:MAG: Fic family protein [Clostridiales bacterium]|nr:Fic family protein [Clostridiales bacterium]